MNTCTPKDRTRDGLLGLPADVPGQTVEQWAARLWFAAYREIYRRQREVYPEWVDTGGEQ